VQVKVLLGTLPLTLTSIRAANSLSGWVCCCALLGKRKKKKTIKLLPTLLNKAKKNGAIF